MTTQTVVQYICDRCRSTLNSHPLDWARIPARDPHKEPAYDLCGKCYADLKRWLIGADHSDAEASDG